MGPETRSTASRFFSLFFAACLSVAACSEASGAGVDAATDASGLGADGAATDAVARDTGTLDTGTPLGGDAASATDAGSTDDVGVRDDGAVMADAGGAGDAASPSDTGANSADTGATASDAGASDAGTANTRVISYLGGNGNHGVDDQARDVAIDGAGNVYIVGGLYRYMGAFFSGAANRRTVAGTTRDSEDVFIVKIAPNGALLYATLVGGPGYDRPYAVEVDAAGRATVAGRAGAGFPTTPGALQRTFAGDSTPNGAYGTQDGFVLRLAPDGALDWATYVGDAGPAFIRDVDIDAAGNAYAAVTLVTNTFAYTTAGSVAPTGPAASHAAIVALDPTGSRVVWGAHLGGSALTMVSGTTPTIRVGPGGDVFVVYSTLDGAEATTAGAVQRTYGGASDAYLCRVSSDGARLVYATYLGGNGGEHTETHHLEVDATGRAVVALFTDTARIDSLVPATALQRTNAGANDWLIAVVAPDASRVEAATFLGSPVADHVEGIALDAAGRIYLSGSTGSAAFPLTGNALPTGTLRDALLVVLRPSLDAGSLIYASRFGASGADDQLRGIAVGSDGSIAAAGHTNSMDVPVINAVQTTYGGGPHDAWWLRLPAIP